MPLIRIALGNMPRLLRDIVVEIIGSEADMRIVGEVGEYADVDELLRDSRPDVLVCDDALMAAPGRKERLMRAHETLKVLLLSDRGKSAALHWVEPRTAQCLDLSPDSLVGMIRTSFGGTATP